MKYKKTDRGFGAVTHPSYANEPEEVRLVQESSAVGDYVDSLDRPGSSFLWVGRDHHLNREEAAELVTYLNSWLATGRLGPKEAG